MSTTTQQAILAGGCFWCMEPPFAQSQGVSKVECGYIGGSVVNPTYEQICTGKTGHYEAVQISYDPDKISYTQLLDIFWRNIDPTQQDGQFADRGDQYRSAIFVLNEEQQKLAEQSKEALATSGKFDKPLATEILPATTFYKAEDYHQEYYKKHPVRYGLYSQHSGRKGFIACHWKK